MRFGRASAMHIIYHHNKETAKETTHAINTYMVNIRTKIQHTRQLPRNTKYIDIADERMKEGLSDGSRLKTKNDF